jgi:hypothetical protein
LRKCWSVENAENAENAGGNAENAENARERLSSILVVKEERRAFGDQSYV